VTKRESDRPARSPAGRNKKRRNSKLTSKRSSAKEVSSGPKKKKKRKPKGFWLPEFLDVANVKDWNCPEPQPLIEGLVMRGTLVNVTADSQVGKGVFLPWLCLQLLQGGTLFKRFKIHKVERILYLFLEDPNWRVKQRIEDLVTSGCKLPEKEHSFAVHVCHNFSLLDKKNFFLEDVADDFDVIILDTYQKATPGIISFDDASQSLILHRLSNLTRNTGVTLFVLDHPAKWDRRTQSSSMTPKGTGGKMQNADCIMLLSRKGDRVTLICRSKDYGEKRLILNRSPIGSNKPKFTLIDETQTLADSRKEHQETQDKILQKLPRGWFRTSKVARKLDIPDRTLRTQLGELKAKGLVEKRGTTRSAEWRRVK